MAIDWYCRECKQMYSFDEPLKHPLLCPQGHTVFVAVPFNPLDLAPPKTLPNMGGFEPVLWQHNTSRPAVGPMASRPPAIENPIPEDVSVKRVPRDYLEALKAPSPILPKCDLDELPLFKELERERKERERERKERERESEWERQKRLIAAGRSPYCTCSAVTFTEFVNPLKSGVLAGGHDVTTTAFFKCSACSDLDIERARQRDRERAAQLQALSRRAGLVLAAFFLTLVVCVLALSSLLWLLFPQDMSLLVVIPLSILVVLVSVVVAAWSARFFSRWLS